MAHVLRRLAVALGVGLAGVILFAGPAAAQAGCAATANGTDARRYGSPQDALRVDASDRVTITVTSAGAAFRSYDVKLEFAGVGWSVASGSVEGRSWSDVVKVDTYASKGVGIYKVVATSTLDGGGSCSTVAYVDVTGKSPLATTAGQVATGAALVGLLGTGIAGLRALRGVAAAGQVLFAEDASAMGAEELEQAHSRTGEGGMGAWTFCAPLAIVAVGLTLRALAAEATSSLVATLGRIHR